MEEKYKISWKISLTILKDLQIQKEIHDVSILTLPHST